jgi:hypothetical protein
MQCPEPGCGLQSFTVDSRSKFRSDGRPRMETYRRRECELGHRFTTWEYVDEKGNDPDVAEIIARLNEGQLWELLEAIIQVLKPRKLKVTSTEEPT